LTKGRIACRAVIENRMIPFAAYTAAETSNAFQWAKLFRMGAFSFMLLSCF